MRASVVASARRSPKTRAVMPTLVAVSAAPRKIAVSRVPAEADAGAGTGDERHDDADDGDGQRGPTDAPELGEVHLHADLDEQQQHAELGEHAEADAALAVEVDEPEHRRADDDAGDDLAEHGRDADPLGALRGELRRDDDHEQVEQQPRQVDGLHGEPVAQPSVEMIASAMAVTSGFSRQPRRRTVTTASGPRTAADADEHRLAAARAELVEAGVTAQLVAIHDPAGVVDECRQDRTFARPELDIHGARRVLLSHGPIVGSQCFRLVNESRGALVSRRDVVASSGAPARRA